MGTVNVRRVLAKQLEDGTPASAIFLRPPMVCLANSCAKCTTYHGRLARAGCVFIGESRDLKAQMNRHGRDARDTLSVSVHVEQIHTYDRDERRRAAAYDRPCSPPNTSRNIFPPPSPTPNTS